MTRHLNLRLREFKVPAIDFNVKTCYEMVDLNAALLSESPLTKNMSDTEIETSKKRNIKEITFPLTTYVTAKQYSAM